MFRGTSFFRRMPHLRRALRSFCCLTRAHGEGKAISYFISPCNRDPVVIFLQEPLMKTASRQVSDSQSPLFISALPHDLTFHPRPRPRTRPFRVFASAKSFQHHVLPLHHPTRPRPRSQRQYLRRNPYAPLPPPHPHLPHIQLHPLPYRLLPQPLARIHPAPPIPRRHSLRSHAPAPPRAPQPERREGQAVDGVYDAGGG